MNSIELRRLDPARNMYRFYRLDIEPDLFGGVRLLRQWGPIGGRGGRIKIAHYDDAALAADALHRQAERKRRRGYGDAVVSGNRG
jgi:predicted DNA-binding WGR domain protein